LLSLYNSEQLSHYYDERTWLKMTAPTRYPDSVVTLTRHMLWQDNLAYREREYSADIVVTARPGWYFGTEATKGTTHGYPLADSMRATLFVSGPNIRRGARLEEPSRLADLTPSLLEMTGTPYVASEMDGTALRAIYQPACPSPTEPPAFDGNPTAVFWEDIDLAAWHPLYYGERAAYPHKPVSINRPDCAWDLSNIAYNIISGFDINVWTMADTVLCPITKKPRLVSNFFDETDRYCRDHCKDWFAKAVAVIDVPGLVWYDYTPTSVGNLQRADRAVDWVQDRNHHLHQKIAHKTNRSDFLGHRYLHGFVDCTQEGFWEAYRFSQRIVVELLDETALNSLENGVDRTINHFHKLPAEIIVD
jgi:hypothetical protein